MAYLTGRAAGRQAWGRSSGAASLHGRAPGRAVRRRDARRHEYRGRLRALQSLAASLAQAAGATRVPEACCQAGRAAVLASEVGVRGGVGRYRLRSHWPTFSSGGIKPRMTVVERADPTKWLSTCVRTSTQAEPSSKSTTKAILRTWRFVRSGKRGEESGVAAGWCMPACRQRRSSQPRARRRSNVSRNRRPPAWSARRPLMTQRVALVPRNDFMAPSGPSRRCFTAKWASARGVT